MNKAEDLEFTPYVTPNPVGLSENLPNKVSSAWYTAFGGVWEKSSRSFYAAANGIRVVAK